MTVPTPSEPVTAPAPPEALAVPAALAASTPLTPAAAITTDGAHVPVDQQGRAIILMCAASLIFAVQDALSRHLGSNYSTYFVVMLRYWFFAAFVVVIAARAPGGLAAASRSRRPFVQITRGLLLAAEVVVSRTATPCVKRRIRSIMVAPFSWPAGSWERRTFGPRESR